MRPNSFNLIIEEEKSLVKNNLRKQNHMQYKVQRLNVKSSQKQIFNLIFSYQTI